MSEGWPGVYAALAAGCDLGGAVCVLPSEIEGSTLRLLPGDVGREGGAAMAAVLEIAARCAPWCLCYAVPRVEHGGRIVRGVFLVGRRTIAVALDGGIRDSVATAHHEIWHAAEDEMEARCVDRVQALAARGREWPGEYLSSAAERRARLYQHYACLRDEGWSPACVSGDPFFEADPVFEAVYSGLFAADVAESDRPRRPGILTRARQAVIARRRAAA